MKRALVALLALVVSSTSCPALGKPTAPSVTDDARARELFKQGDVAYAEGRYEDALAAFVEAHQLSKRPRLLFNIGNALERLGKLGEAADALEKYLPHAKPAERDVLSKRIENLRKRAAPMTKVELEEEPDGSAKPAKPTKPPQPKHEEAKEEPSPAKPPSKAAEPARGAPSGGSGDATLGYILVGAGGAAMGAGALFGVMALSARKDADASCKQSAGQTLCDASAKSAIDRDQRYSLIADLGLGVGLAAVGAGVYFLVSAPSTERAARHRSRVGADVALAPHGGTIRVLGAF